MNDTMLPYNSAAVMFDENRWMHALFLIADTQNWLQQAQKDLLYQVPVKNHKKLLRKNWYLGARALAHILERHYYKIPRHPLAGKFTIAIPHIVSLIRDACQQAPMPIPGSTNMQRLWDTSIPVGYDTTGRSVTQLTVITDAAGEIITAFPGIL